MAAIAPNDDLSPNSPTGPRIPDQKVRLLVCVDWFDPGVRAGGPIRSCVNLVELLHGDLQINVLTGDRDLGAKAAYPGVSIGKCNDWKGKATVWYATRWQHFSGAFLRAIHRSQPRAVYLNSMFSVTGTVIPLLMRGFCWRRKFIVAPRGMLKPTALCIRRSKKMAWLKFLRLTGLARGILFHATSEEEAKEIRTVFGSSARIVLIPNVPCVPAETICLQEKWPAELRLSLVGRVHPIKNVLFVIRLLKSLRFKCSLDVVGPTEDLRYYAECQAEAAELPSNISVRFSGSVTNDQAISLVRNSHVMILPTLGENFGHAIFEALAIGVPVLISDQTYWRGLESDAAGWDLPLNQPEDFRSILDRLGAMGNSEYQLLQKSAHRRALRFFQENDLKHAYLEMFSGC